MVHGNYYGVQYVLTLSKVLDYYDDVLPLCALHRTMFDLVNVDKEANTCQLRVLFYGTLDDRFAANPKASMLMGACDTIAYNYNHVKRETHFEEFKYQDVMVYSRLIKHKNLTRCTKEEYQAELDFHNNLYKDDDDCGDIREYAKRGKQFEIQRIMVDAAYFQEIMILEEKLTAIELTESEQTLVDAVKNHASIRSLVTDAGIDLTSGPY
jgi:hypothetical protein